MWKRFKPPNSIIKIIERELFPIQSTSKLESKRYPDAKFRNFQRKSNKYISKQGKKNNNCNVAESEGED